MTNVNDILARINPATAKKAQLASKLEIERQPLPSVALTKALNGGLRYGAQHMFWGNRSSGKTLLALQTLAMAQKAGKTCLLVDAEGSYTKEWGERLGIDNDNLIVITGEKTFNGVTNQVVEYIRAGIDFVLIDSISTLVPGSYFGKNDELKDMEDTNQIGQHAKDCGKMCSTFNLVNEKTLILLISQITTGIYNWGAVGEPQGGKKTGHINSVTLKLTASLTEANQIKAEVTDGNRVYTKPIGRPVDWTIDKDRGPSMGLKGSYDLYFDGPFVGVDIVGEITKFAVEQGYIEAKGAWFTLPSGERLQGAPKVVKYLREHEDEFIALKDKILG